MSSASQMGQIVQMAHLDIVAKRSEQVLVNPPIVILSD